MLELMIAYIWFGYFVPEDYIASLSNVSYPVQLLLNPPYHGYLPFIIQTSDRFRLDLLKTNGGLYSDFDNTISYNCLMKKLEKFEGEMLLMLMPSSNTRSNNNLIYIPVNRTGMLKEILAQEEELKASCKNKITACFGPRMLDQFKDKNKDRIKADSGLTKCVKHTFDYSWWNDEKKITKKRIKPKPDFADKNLKKIDFFSLTS
jgi:mannosyltransferase OCH1-like enzyme